jgi:protein-L-isoaspartate(D-aspartate) O-methyltransferase
MAPEEGHATLALRQAMVEKQIARRGLDDPDLLRAFLEVPRHLFVPGCGDARDAYGDFPLPIGCGQTISQPFIVALMISMLGCREGARVLEIGTGSGYQTAILARLGCSVVSLEAAIPLAISARRALSVAAPEGDIRIIAADGYYGWEPAAPYEGIIVSASPPFIPGALHGQLADGCRLVLPVGPPGGTQRLFTVTRRGRDRDVTPGEYVRFVPLVRFAGPPLRGDRDD